MAATASTLKHYFPGEAYRNQLRKLYRGDWIIGDGSKKGEYLQRVFLAAKGGVILAYRNKKTVDPAFEHRKWMRSKETPAEIRGVLSTLLSMQPNLGDIPK